ncbi:hypothetical protein Trydic_g9322 [Trypoxylus dichotomus]
MRIIIANVLTFLRTTFLAANTVVTPITREDQESHDALRNIIARAEEQPMFTFETDTALAFEDCAALHEPQFIEPRSEYDEDYEHEDCVPQAGGIITDVECNS